MRRTRVIMEEEKEILELEGDIKMDESSVFVPIVNTQKKDEKIQAYT